MEYIFAFLEKISKTSGIKDFKNTGPKSCCEKFRRIVGGSSAQGMD